jgi:pimeloyl-ACP methyl ester carboxylesterase
VEQLVVKVGDVELECFSHGEGVAIALLRGGTLTVDYLADLADALAAAGFRGVRVNPRGAGASTGPMDGLTLHSFAGDVAGLIQELHLAPAFVLGHAFGNRVARTVAADRPDLVRGVILVSAGQSGASTRSPACLADTVHADRL